MINKIAYNGAVKLSLYLQGKVNNEIFEKFSYILISKQNINEKDVKLIELNELYDKNLFILNNILTSIYNNNIAVTCFELAFLEYLYPSVNELFDIFLPNHKKGVTLEIAAKIANEDYDTCQLKVYEAYQIINKILSIESFHTNILYIHFTVDYTLITAINYNKYAPNTSLENYINFYSTNQTLDKSILWENDINNIANKILDNYNCIIVQIKGDFLSGRKFFCKKIAYKCDFNLLLIDFNLFKNIKESELNLYFKNIIRDAYIFDSAVCIYNIFYDKNDNFNYIPENVQIILDFINDYNYLNYPLFLTSDKNFNIHPFTKNICFNFEIPKLSTLQSYNVWNFFADKYYNISKNIFENIAHNIILPIGKIKSVINQAVFNGDISETMLSKLCYQIINIDNIKNVQNNMIKYTWNDLKLPNKEKNLLNQICSQVKYRKTVFEEWHMRNLYPYGNCISALFTGPSGTGKTMAAHVIANELNLKLFKVDLSQIMDKYIGETEKNLEETFSKAENGNMILFFDEADAIVGKRSEISDAKDKYANSTTSFLLQRIEEFNGIVILATNFSNNIDLAFMRRIKYTIHFSMPNIQIRKEIWKSLFIKEIPYEYIDFEFLAKNFELSGAMIKNIVLNAAFMAADEQIFINMKHIIISLCNEYEKYGKKLTSLELQQYAEYI